MLIVGVNIFRMQVKRDSMESSSEAHHRQQQRLYSDQDEDISSDDDLAPFIADSDAHNLLNPLGNSASSVFPSSTPKSTTLHRIGRYAKYTLDINRTAGGLLGTTSSRRSRLLYSPWTVFTITILFFLLLYIPLFTFRDTSGMCKLQFF